MKIQLKGATVVAERKSFTPVQLKLSETGEVEVAFAQLNVIDRDRDLTEPGAFPAKHVPMSAYGHTSWLGELPTGKGEIGEEDGWAVFKGAFFLDTDQGRNAYNTVKAMGELQEWSYGYNPIDFAYETRDGDQIRILKTLDVFEVSPVLMGAGIGTHTRALKGSPGAGLPYADHLALGLETVQAITTRSKDRAEFRAKEGRVLSSANRERLATLAGEMQTALADLEEILAETDPGKGAPLGAALKVAALLEEARFLGVPI
jgi:hypothetical protein